MDVIEPAYLPWQAPVLERALALKKQQHLPHALLIDTKSDQDISSFVVYLSMLLLCESPAKLGLCGACNACRMMSAGTYSDFNLVTLEFDNKTKKFSKNIKIEQIRNLIHKVSLSHQYAGLKIVAIYPAESMNKASANALLKTLEEPAAGVLMMLVTHNRGRIPVTLRSRCQSWSIDPATRSEALDWLQEQAMEPSEIASYLDFANGDPVLALQLQEHGYAALVDQFKSSLGRYLRGELGVSDLCRGLMSRELSVLRRLIYMTLNAYCYQSSGLDAAANVRPGADRERAQRLLDLRLRAQNQLRIEENNLDLQIQLEDVLISLKQILTRRLS